MKISEKRWFYMISKSLIYVYFIFFLANFGCCVFGGSNDFISLSQSDIFSNNCEYVIGFQNDIFFNLLYSSDFDVNYFEIYSCLVPQDLGEELGQIIYGEESSHSFELVNSSNGLFRVYRFKKNDLRNGSNLIRSKFFIQKRVYFPKVHSIVKFPIDRSVQKEYSEYLSFDDEINFNDKIVREVSKIASGKRDLYKLVFEIALWVNSNVKYNLSSVDGVYSSSSVISSLNGVCKDFNNLFVSMLRYLGIPVRVVTGFSYTDDDDLVRFLGDNWGGHVWSEVLIGDKWVPFDVTYGEFGFVDPFHIVFSKSVFNTDNSVRLNSSGYGYNIKSELRTKNKFEIVDKRFINSRVVLMPKLEISTKERLGFGSYGYFILNISNPNDFYVVKKFSIVGPEEVSFLSNSSFWFILGPNESSLFYVKFHIIDSDFDSGYVYSIPFLFLIDDKKIDEFEVAMSDEFKSFTEQDIDSVLNEYNFTNLFFNSLSFNSFLNYTDYNLELHADGLYLGNSSFINVSVFNPNNFAIRGVSVCISSSQCKFFDLLNINERRSILFKNLSKRVYIINYGYVIKSSVINDSVVYEFKVPKVFIDFYNLSDVNSTKFNGYVLYGLKYRILNHSPNCFLILDSDGFSYNLSKSSDYLLLNFSSRVNSSVSYKYVCYWNGNSYLLDSNSFLVKAVDYSFLDDLRYFFEKFMRFLRSLF